MNLNVDSKRRWNLKKTHFVYLFTILAHRNGFGLNFTLHVALIWASSKGSFVKDVKFELHTLEKAVQL